MDSNIIVAIVSCLGTVLGSAFGVLTSTRLTTYRLQKLEEKVNYHNGVIDRTYKLEQSKAVMEEQIKVANHRIDDLEKEH